MNRSKHNRNWDEWRLSRCIWSCILLNNALQRVGAQDRDFETSSWYAMEITLSELDEERWWIQAKYIDHQWRDLHAVDCLPTGLQHKRPMSFHTQIYCVVVEQKFQGFESFGWKCLSIETNYWLPRTIVCILACTWWASNDSQYNIKVMLAKSLGIPPAVQVWTGKMLWSGSRTVDNRDRQLLRGPNPVWYLSTHGFRRVGLDMSGQIYGSTFRILLFMVAFRYSTVNCRILTMVLHCHFLMYWQPIYSKQVERRSLPHPENESQWSVNNWWSCILGDLGVG